MEKISWTDRVRNVVLGEDGEDQLDRSCEKCGAGGGWRISVGPIV